jgi:hypothetical protein
VSHLDDAVAWAGQLSEPTAENTSIACDFNGTGSSVKCNVLEHLGLAFHASQDFYAQTNWVDRPSKAEISPENPPGLGKSGRADWLDPRKSIPFPEGLISGCPGDIVVLGVTFGCENGALIPIPGKMFVLSENLNKDTGPIGIGMGGVGTTKRGKINGNFGRAVSAAIEDTADKWAYFKEQLQKKFGNKRRAAILCALQRDKFDLATCSKEIAQQQSCAKRETLLTSGDFGDDDETPQIEFSTDDIEIAKTLYEGLSQFCVIEETDITRSEVTHGGVADNGRINAKASAIRALATWHSCPAALNRNLSTTSQRNKEAYQALINKPGSNGKLEMTLLTRLYADCILGAHLQRSSK